MRIAIDISPLSSGHKARGVGSYVSLIRDNILEYDKKNTYVFFEKETPQKGIDLVHYPYFDPFFVTLPGNFKTKTIVTVHDLTPIVFKRHFPIGIRGRLKWRIQKARLKKADLIITDSNCSTRDVRSVLGISEEKVKTVYLAADPAFKKIKTESAQFAREKFNLPDKFILYVGDATWNKNLPALIDAVKKTDYKLVFVGKVWSSALEEISNNPWNSDLKYVLGKIKDDGQFINLGFVEKYDLAAIYNLATTFIMPSIYEGFGLPVLEAMSCGCPVITSRGGSLPEVAGNAALFIDDFSVGSIKDGINKIMENSDLRQDLSKKSISQAKKFSREAMFSNLISAYESLDK